MLKAYATLNNWSDCDKETTFLLCLHPIIEMYKIFLLTRSDGIYVEIMHKMYMELHLAKLSLSPKLIQ